jgi:hypothetical protein
LGEAQPNSALDNPPPLKHEMNSELSLPSSVSLTQRARPQNVTVAIFSLNMGSIHMNGLYKNVITIAINKHRPITKQMIALVLSKGRLDY